MPTPSDEMQSRVALTFQEELNQAVQIWNETPVSILHQRAVHTHALLLAMGSYITYRKESGELEMSVEVSDFLDRFLKDQ